MINNEKYCQYNCINLYIFVITIDYFIHENAFKILL